MLGETKNISLGFGVSCALLEAGEVTNLLFRQSDPPTEGLVVVSSDVARCEVGHLEVGEFPELWSEFAPDGLRHGRGSRQHFRGVRQRAVHVGHLAEFRSQAFEQRSGLGTGFVVIEWGKVWHVNSQEGSRR